VNVFVLADGVVHYEWWVTSTQQQGRVVLMCAVLDGSYIQRAGGVDVRRVELEVTCMACLVAEQR
jgi:hypothetical protein